MKTRLDVPRAALCTHRSLCVPRHLSKTARKTLGRLTRGWPPWRTLRASMDQVDALCDRRCRTQTARETRRPAAARAAVPGAG